MKKKFLLIFAVVLLSMLALGAICASADTEGIFTYSISNDEATITDCDNSASGEITIPDVLGGYPVTSIGNDAFYNCIKLTSITIPDSITSIGDWAFSNCTGLADITIPNGVTSIGSFAFSFCDKLPAVAIPDSVTSISEGAFYSCEVMATATLGAGIKQIPESCFYQCNNLIYVCVPKNVTTIGDNAFNECSKVEAVFYTGNKSAWEKISFNDGNKKLTGAEIVFDSTKKTYSFETNCDTTSPDVTNYAVFTMPAVKNEGKNIVGWYTNSSLSGKAITFPYYGKATKLYAKWKDSSVKAIYDTLVSYSVVNVVVNGKHIQFDQSPILANGTTMVPFRALFEALDADVQWDKDKKIISATKGEKQISLQIDSTQMLVNGSVETLDVPTLLVNNVALAPVRVVSEAFGCKVEWVQDTQTVIITQ